MIGKKEKRKRVIGLLSVGVSVILLFWVFSGLDWVALSKELSRLSLVAFIAPAILCIITFILRALRWRLLLGARGSFTDLYEATVVGAFGNAVLPLRAGELLRPWLLARSGEVSFTSGLASVVTERLFDVLGLLFFLSLSIGMIPELPPVILLGAKALGSMSLALVFALFASYFARERVLRILSTVLHRVSPGEFARKSEGAFREFLNGLSGIQSLKDLTLILLLTVILWGVIGVFHLSGFWLFGVYPSIAVGMITAVVIGLAVAAPSGPGFVGTYQFGCIVGISTICRYEREFAVAYSVVFHIFSTVLLCLLGMQILHKRGLILSKLAKESTDSAPVDEPVVVA